MNTVKTNNAGETTDIQQIATSAEFRSAQYYEEKFVPTLFKRWSSPLIEASATTRGDRVLDIACGTGVVTRDVAEVVGSANSPIGLDIAPGMLAVAQSLSPQIEWRLGSADSLPFPDKSFDRVLCQFGLMFFSDRVNALTEMRRVLKPGGRLAVAVWNSLENNPGFALKVEILESTAGTAAADAVRAPFCLGDARDLHDMTEQAGIQDFKLSTIDGDARFPDMHEFVDAELRGWLPVMGINLDDSMVEEIHQICEQRLAHFCNAGSGELVMPTSAHIFSGGC